MEYFACEHRDIVEVHGWAAGFGCKSGGCVSEGAADGRGGEGPVPPGQLLQQSDQRQR